MEAKNADLAALRINRSPEATEAGPAGRARRWLLIGLPTAAILVVGAVFVITGGALSAALPVRLTPATMVSPMRAGAVLVASGYVVAQRKAAVASKGTGRLVYLGVVEGDRVRAGQVIARIEDADIKAQLAQAQANLDLSRAELRDAEHSLARERLLLDSAFSSQASYDAAEARYQRVRASIAIAQATVQAAEVALENTVIRAPFDGTVLSKNADVGEVVAPLAASAVSKSAVAERNGRSVVYVVEGGRAVEVPVTVGRRVGTAVAIREGLGAGTQVIDSVGERVRRGVKVKEQ